MLFRGARLVRCAAARSSSLRTDVSSQVSSRGFFCVTSPFIWSSQRVCATPPSTFLRTLSSGSEAPLLNADVAKAVGRGGRVLFIGVDGKKLGETSVEEALAVAKEQDLDLRLIAQPGGDALPICKLVDFFKEEFAKRKKIKDKKKSNNQKPGRSGTDKVIKMQCRIGDHDFATKINSAKRLLLKQHKVRIKLHLKRDDEVEDGLGLLDRATQDLREWTVLDRDNRQGHTTFKPNPVT